MCHLNKQLSGNNWLFRESTLVSCTKTIKIAQHIFMRVSKQVNGEVIRDTNV